MKKTTLVKRSVFLIGFLTILICFGNVAYSMVLDDDAGGQKQGLTMGEGLIIRGEKSGKEASQYAPGEVIIKLKTEKSPQVLSVQSYSDMKAEHESILSRIVNQYTLKDVKPVPVFTGLHNRAESNTASLRQLQAQRGLLPVYVLKTGEDVLETCARLSEDPEIEYAEPNYIMKAQMVPNDPYYGSSGSWGQPYYDLWGLKPKKLNCELAWDISQGDGVVVAVIDTGVDYNHEDLAGNIWINQGEIPNNGIDDDGNGYVDDVRGWDFAYGDNDPMDGYGHGTHVAGTIAAIGNNSLGVIGVAPRAKIMPVKGLGDYGSGYITALANCVAYAADNGADVLNNSWGGSGTSDVLEGAFNYAHSLGCVSIASAGNANVDVEVATPANIDTVIAVAATTYQDEKAGFSNWGLGLDVAAPGVDILSLRAKGTDMYGDGTHIVGNYYYRANGTSMACPHVAGLAALIKSRFTSFTNEQIQQVIRTGADDLGNTGFDELYGYGRINAFRSLNIEAPLVAKINISKHFEIGKIIRPEIYNVYGKAYGNSFDFYRLEYYDGDAWHTICESKEPATEVLGSWDLTSLTAGYYMLRLSAVNESGEIFRDLKKVYVCESNFFVIGSNSIWGQGGLLAVDVNGDGEKEIILRDWVLSNTVKVLDSIGNELWSYVLPKYTEGGMNGVSIGDINKDGALEIVAANGTSMFALNAVNGGVLDNWPVEYDYYVFDSLPILADLDKDGASEIITTDSGVNARYGDASIVGGFPVDFDTIFPDGFTVDPRLAVGDIDNDSYPEIIAKVKEHVALSETKTHLFAIRHDGSIQPGWPIRDYTDYPNVEWSYPVIADINNDGYREIIIPSDNGYLFAFNYKGELIPGWPVYLTDFSGYLGISVPAIGDIDLDGYPEIILTMRSGKLGTNDYIYRADVWRHDGTHYNGMWPIEYQHVYMGDPIVGDINGDAYPEILIDVPSRNGGAIHAFDMNGVNISGWPKIIPFALFVWPPAITSSNGSTDILFSALNGDYIGRIQLNSAYDERNMPWPIFQHDPQHTGCYTAANRPPVLEPIGDKSVKETGILEFKLSASDRDGDKLTYLAEGLPVGAKFTDNGDNAALFIWKPTYEQAGTYKITFTVSDEESEDSETITITVIDVNRPPVIIIPILVPAREGRLFEFILRATDADGDNIKLEMLADPDKNDNPGWSFEIISQEPGETSGRFSWTPNYEQAGNYVVYFAASDGKGGDNLAQPVIARVEIEVMIEDKPNTSPEMLYVRSYWNRYFLRLGKDKEDGYRLNYSYRVDQGEWSIPSRRRWIRISEVSKGLEGGTHLFQVKTIDKEDAESDPKSVEFKVTTANTPPVMIYRRNIRNYFLYWYGRDTEDGYRLKYSYSIDGREWSKPSTRRWLFIRNLNVGPGRHICEVKAIDSKGLESNIKSVSFTK